MRINHNLSAQNTLFHLGMNSDRGRKFIEKLSSGLQINRAADDAAGLQISEKMRTQVRGLNRASHNIQDGISLLQTAESGMDEIGDMIARIRELVVYAANDTNDMGDRQAIQEEIDNLVSEVDGIASRTEYNTMKLLGGKISEPKATGVGYAPEELKTMVQDAYRALSSQERSDMVGVDRESTFVKVVDFINSSLPPGFRCSVGIMSDETADYLSETFFWTDVSTVSGLDNFFENYFCAPGISADAPKREHITCIEETEEIVKKIREDWVALPEDDDARKNGKVFYDWITDKFDLYCSGTHARSHPSQFYNAGEAEDEIRDYMMRFDGVTPTSADADILDKYLSTATISGMDWTEPFHGTKFEEPAKDGLWIQTGANSWQGLHVKIGRMDTQTLGLKNASGENIINVCQNEAEKISSLLKNCDGALEYTLKERAKLGAMQNRLDHARLNVDNTAENLTASESRIRDTDMAKEMMNYVKSNMLTQAASSILAMGMQQPQAILQLLQ